MRVVSLFSGAGGLDLGFKLAGHEVVWANDNFVDAVETYKQNIGQHIVLADIRTIPSTAIPQCDIVIGGFPCQGFSVANTRRQSDDDRNFLYLELLRVIRDKKPLYFLAENVKGILSLGKGAVLSRILDDFAAAGYRVKYDILNAADYGVPQIRERVIFLGTREDVTADVAFPTATHAKVNGVSLNGKSPWVSVGSALSEVPEPEGQHNLKNHTYSKYKLRFNGYIGHREIDPNKPAPTVTARGDDKGGVVVLHHPMNHRRMSARELALVQSFPIDYEFAGCRSSVYRQVANAVPPLLAQALAQCFPLKERRRKKNEGSCKTVS